MDAISQIEALGIEPLTADERAVLFPARRFDGLDCLSATFQRHTYAPHLHETYVLGTIESGCESFSVRGVKHYARPEHLTFVNPLETHDGAPHEGGYSYRMTYPSVALMREVAASLAGREVAGTPYFGAPLTHDPEGALLFRAAHRTIEAGLDLLAGEEMLLRFYARCLARHADWPVAPLGREAIHVGRARDLIETHYDEDLSLAEIARLSGLARHHLIRAFRRETGLTPHAYLVDVRVRRARDLLSRGVRPGDVAAATGFCDQAHLTRAFKARYALTPGAFRAAHLI